AAVSVAAVAAVASASAAISDSTRAGAKEQRPAQAAASDIRHRPAAVQRAGFHTAAAGRAEPPAAPAGQVRAGGAKGAGGGPGARHVTLFLFSDVMVVAALVPVSDINQGPVVPKTTKATIGHTAISAEHSSSSSSSSSNGSGSSDGMLLLQTLFFEVLELVP